MEVVDTRQGHVKVSVTQSFVTGGKFSPGPKPWN